MEVIILPVLQTSLNLPGLIQACREMNQPNPAAGPDEKGLNGLEHTVAVVNSLQNLPYLTGSVLYLGYMIACWPNDMDLILSHTGAMPHLYHSGVVNFQCAIVSGSIHQWEDACRRACVKDSTQVVRFAFNKIYRDMENKLSIHMARRDNGDGTFLLENK